MHHPECFPVEINKAPYETLLRVPGIGVKSAQKIITARRQTKLDYNDLRKLGVVLKRANYFILCSGKRAEGLVITEAGVMRQLMSASTVKELEQNGGFEQLSFFEAEKSERSLPTLEDTIKCLTGEM